MTSMANTNTTFDYDFAVIGGGSGGLAAAKEASKLGARTVLFDFVKPTVHGAKWGLGGTCVNVGCIPKKLMHYTSLMGSVLHHDAKEMGWQYQMTSPTVDWTQCVQSVQSMVKKLSFGYRGGLRKANVTYINALAKFSDSDPHNIDYTDPSGTVKKLTADKVLIAVGGRPSIPADIPNARELAITSDDIFSLPKAPGKTLVIGGAYIALETAGFLTEMGFPVTVAIRSVPLRSFDQQCAAKVVELMAHMGTKFLHKTLVKSLEKLPSGQIRAVFTGDFPADTFDTVLFASGRSADTASLNLNAVGVKMESDGKVVAPEEATTNPHVFAIGDCVSRRPELTPVAIRAGEILARRLYANSAEKMDYNCIATSIFTPIEYGVIGLSEEAAVAKYGAHNVETYLQEHTNLEISSVHRPKVESLQTDEFDTEIGATCLAKLVCLKTENEKVVGFHFVGPNAGELTQGFALAMYLGATKADFDKVIGIHPTDAEAFMNLSVTRSSGKPFSMAGCGGGKCG